MTSATVTNLHIEQEVLALIHKQTLFLVAGTVFASAMAVVFLRNVMDTELLYLWLGAIWLTSLVRYLLNTWRYDQRNISQLKARFFIGSFLSGSLWGGLALAASSTNDPFTMAFLAITVSCLSAAAVAGLAAYPVIYYAFLFPAMAGVTISFYFYDVAGSELLLFAGFFYVLSLLIFCRNINKTTMEAIRLRFENEDLLKEVQTQAEIAEKANIDKSRFLAAASHDLRQPFHALTLFVSSINETELNEQNRDLLANIKSSTSALERMFTELLDVSKLDAGAVTPQRNHFSTRSLINEIREEYRTIAHERQLDFNCSNADEVIYSDPLLCERILRNILSNAFNYTKTGSIQVSVSHGDKQVAISITDTGIGISEDKHETIFSEFEQLQNPERDRNKGLGLGLAIVKRLCDLLELEIHLSSRPGQGSTFTVMFPVGDKTQLPVLDMESRPAAAVSHLEGAKILVIDDDSMILKGMKAQLEKWQCQGSYATGHKEAVSLMEAGLEPDLIICDFRLRDELNGVEVIAALQTQLDREIAAIIITGDTDPAIIKDILDTSGALVLHKPVQSGKLRMALNSLLQT